MIALLVPVAAAAVAGTSWRRRSPSCKPVSIVQPGPEPTRAEIVRLIGDAEQRLSTTHGADHSAEEASRFAASAAGLRAAIHDGNPARECRALATARSELRALPDDPRTASQRNAMALALDLTAAFIARGSSSSRSTY